MPHAMLDFVSETSIDEPRVAVGAEVARERLLHAARQAGLHPAGVVRLAEVLTDRAWDRCEMDEIILVALALLEISARVSFDRREGELPCEA